jgi:xylose isomerase
MNEVFKEVPKIEYEGPESKNPLAFKFYNPDEIIGNKTMKEHLRFSMAFWHTMNGDGTDPFGSATMQRSWLSIADPLEQAKTKMRALFELTDKLQIPYFCFHDRDIAPEGADLRESNKNLDAVVSLAKELMQASDTKLLWGTANLFSHPRYAHGAATSPFADIFAMAAAQVKKALEVTKELGGSNYVFWGGREGYDTLLNTEMKVELDNLARFMQLAVEYAEEIGFTGQFLIEPKPKEPTAHQYDFDVAACLFFLEKYGLSDKFKMNIEMNHAILAAHTFQHEVHFARINSMLGSLDANEGDYLLGWDTDRFPASIYETTLVMYEVLKNGGISPGGLNFDAKLRRSSYEPLDIFYGHILGMDAYARGLRSAYALLDSGELEQFVDSRYDSYKKGIGKKIREKSVGFKELEEYAMNLDTVEYVSGRREFLEAILNRYI